MVTDRIPNILRPSQAPARGWPTGVNDDQVVRGDSDPWRTLQTVSMGSLRGLAGETIGLLLPTGEGTLPLEYAGPRRIGAIGFPIVGHITEMRPSCTIQT